MNGQRYIERVVEKAIRHNIALYAIHTNLDNVLNGVNARICERIGVKNCRILSPKNSLLKKLVTFVPVENAEEVKNALFEAGCGKIGGYDECSFSVEGTGNYRAGKGTNPYAGEIGARHHEKEIRLETIFPGICKKK